VHSPCSCRQRRASLAPRVLLRTVSVGGGPTAVAVAERSGHIFVGNSNADTVSMLDARTGPVLRTARMEHSPPRAVAVDDRTGRVRRPQPWHRRCLCAAHWPEWDRECARCPHGDCPAHRRGGSGSTCHRGGRAPRACVRGKHAQQQRERSRCRQRRPAADGCGRRGSQRGGRGRAHREGLRIYPR